MKKRILSALFLMGLSGWAAAQSTSTQATTAVKKEEAKKESKAKKSSRATQASMKAAETNEAKFVLEAPPRNDTLGIPKVKED